MRPIITKSQLDLLNELISKSPHKRTSKELMQLQTELDRAEIVADNKISAQIIQIGSRCTIEETRTKSSMDIEITTPLEADLTKKKFSVLSPIGVAVIGFREGYEFEWQMPGGLRKFKVLCVYNEVADFSE